MKRPNIVLLLADDRRHDTIAALGNTGIGTPNMDSLVREGTSFDHAFNPGGTCAAVCMSSLAMIHTGRGLFHLHADGESIPEDHVLMGEHLRRHGYESRGIGKWLNSADAFARSFSGGPELVFAEMRDNRSVPDKSTDLLTDAACDWLSARGGDQPFFLYLACMATHEPRRCLAEYHAMTAQLDQSIGRVIAALCASCEIDNTIIVFAGVNGLALGQHGLFGKQDAYDHSVRVPLVFRGPGIPSDLRIREKCFLLDIFPTLCDLVGIPTPPSAEGRTLFAAARGRSRLAEPPYLYLAYGSQVRAVRGDQYKLIEYAGGTGRRTQFFDLVHDPAEIRNRADEPEMAAQVEQMRAELIRLRDSSGDLSNPSGREFWEAFG